MNRTKTSLNLLRLEMIITYGLLSMPIMSKFYASIGMDQGQIGLSQTCFTIVVLALNIPTGWIADKFSHKLCNAFGDIAAAMGFVLYSQSKCFMDVVIAESVLAIAMAFTQGADFGMLKAYTKIMDATGKLFDKVNVQVAVWQPIESIIVVAIGGLVGMSYPRTTIAVSGLPFLVGGIMSFFMQDDGERLEPEHKNPFKDMWRVTKSIIKPDIQLRWLIIACAIASGITHVMIWAFTPLITSLNGPSVLVSVGWVLNSLSITIGAKVAGRYVSRLPGWAKFLLPTLAVFLALTIMSLHLSFWTIWLYSLLGMAQGWAMAVMMPMIQNKVSGKSQATAVSITKCASQILYAPLVWLVGLAGSTNIRMSMVATIVIFVPLVLVTAARLKNLEKK